MLRLQYENNWSYVNLVCQFRHFKTTWYRLPFLKPINHTLYFCCVLAVARYTGGACMSGDSAGIGPLREHYNDVSNHQPHHCLLSRLFGLRSKKTSKLRVAGLCVGNSPVTGEFSAQMASNAEIVSIWWCHHDVGTTCRIIYDYIWIAKLQFIPFMLIDVHPE